MDYKIDKIKESNTTVVMLSGVLSAKSAHEIDCICKETIGNIRVDVSNVTGYESEGVRFLEEISKKGVALNGVSPFLSLLISEQINESF